MRMSFCKHNCFQCPYDDCVCPDDEISPLEEMDARKRDAEISRARCAADMGSEEAAVKKMRSERSRIYARRHRVRIKQVQAEWYQRNRERRISAQMAYYEANKERINAERREAYQRRQALKAMKESKKEGDDT